MKKAGKVLKELIRQIQAEFHNTLVFWLISAKEGFGGAG
jgi:hypothetical protein